MKMITKKNVVCLGISYLKTKGKTNAWIAEKIDVDPVTIVNWLDNKTNISEKNWRKFLKAASEIYKNDSREEFLLYLIEELVKKGFDEKKCRIIIERKVDILEIIDGLINDYHNIEPLLQQKIDVMSTIAHVRAICRSYSDYIKVSDQQINNEEDGEFGNWLFSLRDENKPDIIVRQNYLVLKFLNKYKVALIVTNTVFEDVGIAEPYICRWKEKNKIDLIIVYTDIEKSFTTQGLYIKNCNLFFEVISKRDLTRVVLQNVGAEDILSINERINSQFYAQAMFERLTAYFNVIRNEIIFSTYMQEQKERNQNKKSESDADTDICKSFVDKILLKEVYKYSYLSRHTIYFERKNIREKVEDLLKARKKDKLGIVVELCYPNSFLSSAIHDKCEKLLLFTSSYSAYKMMKEKNSQSGDEIFPDNIQMNLSHINPQCIPSQCPEIVGKTDLVILGYGMGSSLVNLTEYLRHINSWLAPGGMLFISFANAESIILKKQLNMGNIFETTPLYFSDYWQYTARNNLKFLSRVKKYKTEEAKGIVSIYVDVMDWYTYPFLSGLIDLDENDKGLMADLREIDKTYAIEKKKNYGHFIDIIGIKNEERHQRENVIEEINTRIHSLIIRYLQDNEINYDIIEHSVTIDTQSLMKALVEVGQDITKFDVVKTVVLEKALSNENREAQLDYVIMPREYEINLENYNGKLMTEQDVVKMLGWGSITPLVAIPTVASYINSNDKYHFYVGGAEQLRKKYVILSSGINTQSIRIERATFIELLNKLAVKKIDDDRIISQK